MRKIVSIIILLCIVFSFSLAQQKNMKNSDDYVQWLKQYENAKARLRTGNSLTYTALALASLSCILYFVDTEQTLFGKEYKSEYQIAGLVAVGISVVGFVISQPAKSDVKMLEMEGKKKGYINVDIIPIRKGVVFSLKVSF